MVFGFRERKEPTDLRGFWNTELLAERGGEVIKPFCDKAIKYGSYELKMGPEVYVSPSDQSREPAAQTIRALAPDEAFTIPPGQFAFLLSEEEVWVPDDAIAWISMRAKVKWKGLINVSGFHVDPGFKGRLIFAVYNAGPVVIHLRRGEKLFLIWFASLVSHTKSLRNEPVQEHIPASLISGIGGELQSLANLNAKIGRVEAELKDKSHEIGKEANSAKTQATIALTLVLAIIAYLLKSAIAPNVPPVSPQPATVSQDVLDQFGGIEPMPQEITVEAPANSPKEHSQAPATGSQGAGAKPH